MYLGVHVHLSSDMYQPCRNDASKICVQESHHPCTLRTHCTIRIRLRVGGNPGVMVHLHTPIRPSIRHLQESLVLKEADYLEEKEEGFIRRNLSRCDAKNVKAAAFKVLVDLRPKLEYAAVVLDPHQSYLVDKLEMVQRRAARFVYNDYRTTSVSELLKALEYGLLSNNEGKTAD